MGFLDDLGLLARHVPDDAKNALKGLLGGMPLTQMARGEFQMPDMPTKNGLAEALRGMPKPFDNSPEANVAAMEQAMNYVNPMGLLGKIVYHGSPHKFDKFDASKIGTGEGAQAYGHGVYLADSEGVAGQYKNLAPREFLDGPINWDNPIHVGIRSADLGGGIDGGIARLMRTVQARTSKPENIRIAREAIEFLRSGESFDKYARPGGALYKADLPDEWIPKMLDWDKPLSQQPENVRLMAKDFGLSGDATGKDIYYALSNQARDIGIIKGQPLQTTLPGSQEKATADLLGFGVPGIRYMDGGSRMTPTQEESIKKALERAMARGDEGVANSLRAQLENRTSNYVVFPGMEDKVKILERNGVPLDELLGLLGR